MDKQVTGSLTQSWQVGPSFKEKASDATQTILVPQVSIKIESEDTPKQKTIGLNFGVHSFLLIDENVVHKVGINTQALFEINVDKSASFFVDVSKQSVAKLNQSPCGWARLQLGDEIALGRNRLIFEGEKDPQKKRNAKNKKPKKNKKVTVSLLWVLIAIFISLLAAYVGYSAALNNKLTTAKESQGIDEPVFESAIVEQKRQKEETLNTTVHLQPFLEADYLKALIEFREGKETLACEKLSQGASRDPNSSIWVQKAKMFVARRCQSGD